jgi:hypothetical protein
MHNFHIPGIERVRANGRQLDLFVSADVHAFVEQAHRAAAVSNRCGPDLGRKSYNH